MATHDVSGLCTMDLQFWRCHESMGCVQTPLRVTPEARDAPEATTGTSEHTPCSHLHPPAPQICTQTTFQVIQANSSAPEITPEPDLKLIWLFPEKKKKNNGQSSPGRQSQGKNSSVSQVSLYGKENHKFTTRSRNRSTQCPCASESQPSP